MDLNLIILLLLTLVFSLIAIFWLLSNQKKNRRFDKKGIFYYSVVYILFFGILGLLGLIDPASNFFGRYWLAQGAIIIAGTVHAWLLFSIFDWPDRSSFLSESLFTLFINLSGAFIFILIYYLSVYFSEFEGGQILKISTTLLVFIVPYFILRTYDYISMIPNRMFVAWPYPDGLPKKLDLRKSNIIYIKVNLNSSCDPKRAKEINQRTRLPFNTRVGDFFHHFVTDYNKEGEYRPIECLNTDMEGNSIGWVFYVYRTSGSRKTLLDPYKVGTDVIREGDTVSGLRVLLDKKASLEKYNQNKDDIEIIDNIFGDSDHKSNDNDDDIIFREK